MPNLNDRQFKVNYPSQEQLTLPGLGAQTEQMRLFDTQRAGPANVYTANPSADAAQWRDRDKQVALNEGEQATVDNDEYELTGEFFDFPIGRSDREYMASGGAHQRTLTESKDAGTYLGHENYPTRTNPGLQFRDLQTGGDGYAQAEWWTPNDDDGTLGTLVGRVDFHEDEWGPNVDHAEINPLYRGRGFSREAIPDFAGNLEAGEGIVHAGSYTTAGAGAFHAKGVPTSDDIERGYEDFVANYEVDEDYAADIAREELQYTDPNLDWDSDPDDWSPSQSLGWEEGMDYARNKMRDEYSQFQGRDDFRENLEMMQEQVIAQLPGRKTAFKQGWKPQAKFGRQEELEGMPLKYTGGRA